MTGWLVDFFPYLMSTKRNTALASWKKPTEKYDWHVGIGLLDIPTNGLCCESVSFELM